MKTNQHILMALALGALGAAGCSPQSKPKTAPAPVLVAKVSMTNVPVRIEPEPVGHVLPISSVTIRPQIGGILQAVHFAEGQEVQKGDLLFTIDPRPSQAALDVARAALARDAAQLENAKIQFARDQKLFNDKIESQDVFDTSKANVDALAGTVQSDRAAIGNAELNLEFTAIRAPVSGRTGGLQFHEGNVVKAPDDVLLTINQIHPIYVAFAVAEQNLPEIKKQMRDKTLAVTASFEKLMGPAPAGTLTFIDNAVDTTTGTIMLRATFPNDDSSLWPGQFVQVSVTLGELTNALVVPSQAVQTGQNGSFVYVVKADQTVELRSVKTGLTFDDAAVIEQGLAAGETVVTDGQLRLVPGVKIEVKSSIQTDAGMATTNAP
jgi:multidrug efflux system membrane fusion protein